MKEKTKTNARNYDTLDEEDDSDIRMSAFGNASEILDLVAKQKDLDAHAIKLVRENVDSNHRSSYPSEFIVYDTKQVRLKYLIEVTNKDWVKREYEKVNPNCQEE